MERTIGALEAASSFKDVLREVEVKGDSVLVENNGQPVAVLVPLELYNRWKRRREAFFDKIQKAAQESNLSAEEAENLVNEAIRASRSKSKI